MLNNWCFHSASTNREERLDVRWTAEDGSVCRTVVYVEYDSRGSSLHHVSGPPLDEDVIDEVRSDLQRFDSQGWQKPLHYEVFV